MTIRNRSEEGRQQQLTKCQQISTQRCHPINYYSLSFWRSDVGRGSPGAPTRSAATLNIAHVVQHAFIYHNETTCAATRRVFWALNASKMHLRWGFTANPTRKAYNTPPGLLAGGVAAPFPRTPPPLLAFDLKIRPFKLGEWGVHPQNKLLAMPLLWRCRTLSFSKTTYKAWFNGQSQSAKFSTTKCLSLNCSKLTSVCLRWAGRLFNSSGPAAAKHLSA